MRTTDSDRYLGLTLGSLDKAGKFEERKHPRGGGGRWADKPKPQAQETGVGSLARQASAMRLIGDEAGARRVEERLRAARGERGERPAPAPQPRPAAPRPAAPRPAPRPARPPMPGMPPPDWEEAAHERMRIQNARLKEAAGRGDFRAEMRRRIKAIRDPVKMRNFANELFAQNEVGLAGEARARLREMGFDAKGNAAVEPAARPAEPRRPEPPPREPARPPARPVGEPPPVPRSDFLAPRGGRLGRVPGSAGFPSVPHRSAGYPEAVQSWIDIAGARGPRLDRMVREELRSVMSPEPLFYLCGELERRGLDDLAEFGYQELLYVKGHDREGFPVQWEIDPPEGLGPISKPARGSEPWKVGVKHRMGAVDSNPEMVALAGSDFRAAVERVRTLGSGGVGETHKVTFRDGTKAVYKPSRGTGLDKFKTIKTGIEPSVPERNREMAAYKISESAGFDVVPRVEFVDYKVGSGGGGHTMAWVEGHNAIEKKMTLVQDAQRGHPDIHRIAALDFISANTDRHSNNFMKGVDGRYYAIDNGLAFCTDMNTEGYLSNPHGWLAGKVIPVEVRAEIASIQPETVRSVMEGMGFSKVDVAGSLARLEHLKGMDVWSSPREDLRRAGGVYERKYR